MLKKINFVVNQNKLREMAYGDTVYAWLLLHSHYDETEDHNYIYAKDFTFIQIANDIHRNRATVSKRFKALLPKENELGDKKDLMYYNEYDKVYILPCFREFEQLDADTVLNLFWMCGENKKREEVIKIYAWIKRSFKKGNKNISYEDLIKAFGHSDGNEAIYQRYKDILTTLQGAGLIRFRTALNNRLTNGTYGKTFYIYEVNDKASKEWLDKKKKEDD